MSCCNHYNNDEPKIEFDKNLGDMTNSEIKDTFIGILKKNIDKNTVEELISKAYNYGFQAGLISVLNQKDNTKV